MDFAGVSYLAVLVAAIASFVFGGIWYGVFSQPWMAAVGKTEEELKNSGQSMPVLLGMTFVGLLLMAWVLAGLIGHLGSGQVTVWNGLLSGAFVWLGFVATTLFINHSYQGAERALTLIDGAHWLGVLMIQGTIIGLFGV